MVKTQNILIVEGKEDKAFIEALIQDYNSPPTLELIYIDNDDIKELKSLNSEALKNALESIKTELNDDRHLPPKIIGIILDIDTSNTGERLAVINKAMQEVFPTASELTDIGYDNFANFIEVKHNNAHDDEITFKLGCYLMGENLKQDEKDASSKALEDVLQVVASQEPTVANCVKNCFESAKDIDETQIKKDWIHFYLKYDVCKKQHRTYASKNCSLKALNDMIANQYEPFDFNAPALDNLKGFLKNFR